MAAIQELVTLINETVYQTWADLHGAMNDWAVCDKFTYRTPSKEPSRATYTCAVEGCPWRCRARKNKDGLIVLSIVEADHQCLGTGVVKFRSSSSHEWLDKVISRHLEVTKATNSKIIVDCLRVRFGEEISYKVAQLCHLRLLDGSLGSHRYSFQLLPAYKQRLEECSAQVYTDLSVDPTTSKSTLIILLLY